MVEIDTFPCGLKIHNNTNQLLKKKTNFVMLPEYLKILEKLDIRNIFK